MKHLSVQKQLILAFGTLVAMLIVVALLGARSLSAANDRFSDYVSGVEARQSLATDILVMANRRAVGVRDMVLVKSPAERDAAKATTAAAHATLKKKLGELKEAVGKASDASDKDRAMVGDIDRVEASYGPVAVAILELAAAGRRDEAIEKINVECRPLLASLLTALGDYAEYGRTQARSHAEASSAAYASQRAVMVALSAVAVLVGFVLAWLITRRLVGSLGAEPAALSAAAHRIAAGDLRAIAGVTDAAPGSVLSSMGAMQAQLVGLIGQVRTSADGIATASSQIAQGNNDLSSRTEEQASALEKTASSMEELGSTVTQNAENAREADRLAKGASEVAVRGGDVVGQVVETMKGINDSSKRIAEIIGVIDGIAFQTNILALNAAVEAARAGEQGRGFAVVASEVRSLAGRSADAAKEIKSLIAASVERVERGTTLVDEAGATMTEIVGSIGRVTQIMSGISSASSEQAAGVSQVGEAVTAMDRSTQQNAALVEESAAAAESMKMEAERLVRAVAVFRLDEGAQATTAAWTAPERRGPNRATNVVRPAFARPTKAAATASVHEPVVAKTGTDDWSSF